MWESLNLLWAIEQLPTIVDENTPCYFIMAMKSDDHEGGRVRYCRFFINRETAFKAIRENWGDIHNGKYDIAWIECVHPYILAWSTECVWFRWDDEKDGYCEADPPKRLPIGQNHHFIRLRLFDRLNNWSVNINLLNFCRFCGIIKGQ